LVYLLLNSPSKNSIAGHWTYINAHVYLIAAHLGMMETNTETEPNLEKRIASSALVQAVNFGSTDFGYRPYS